jgi:hypothetical protein
MNAHVQIHRLIAVALTCLTAGAAGAADPDFGDKDFSLRFPAAMSRFATYADVGAMGGASGGSRWSTSVNPASTAWEPMATDLRMSASAQYNHAAFSKGLVLHVASESLAWDAGKPGVFQAAFAQVRSTDGMTRDGLDTNLRMDFVQGQWAKRMTDAWAVGANVNFSKSSMSFDWGDAPVSDSNGEAYGFRVGTLHRLADRLLGGVVFDYGFSRDRTTMFDFMEQGTGPVRTADTTHQFLLRPGLSYEYMKDCNVYADCQFGWFRNDTGSLQVGRFLLGVEHSIIQGLYVRGGTGIDQRGNASWSTGLGLSLSKTASIDLAYQDDAFPELRRDFGRARVVTFSFCVSF